MTGSNLGWHSHRHIHGPPRARSDPRGGFICIRQSIRTHVLAQNPSIPAYQYWHATQAKHPSGSPTCFWVKHRHPSALDFYKPNDLIWINKSRFQTFGGVDMQKLHPSTSSDLRSRTSKNNHNKGRPLWKDGLEVDWYWRRCKQAGNEV